MHSKTPRRSLAEYMHESVVFCCMCTMSSWRKLTFAISSPDGFSVEVCFYPLTWFLSVTWVTRSAYLLHLYWIHVHMSFRLLVWPPMGMHGMSLYFTRVLSFLANVNSRSRSLYAIACPSQGNPPSAVARAITPFKVIQSHRVWYQSKAHMRFPNK